MKNMNLSTAIKNASKAAKKYGAEDKGKNKLERLKKKESNLVARGYKAVDEGRDKKADRLLKRAAKVENRVIRNTPKLSNTLTEINKIKYISKPMNRPETGELSFKNTPRLTNRLTRVNKAYKTKYN